MLLQTLETLFTRDLNKLRSEIELYTDETKIWCVENGIANSAGNLCLHLCGNLKTYIGAELGKIAYTRNRDLEFSLKDIPRAELLRNINETIGIVQQSLKSLPAEETEKEYPALVFDKKMSTGYFLVHLAMHLSYHLGQVNYHRRLLDSRS